MSGFRVTRPGGYVTYPYTAALLAHIWKPGDDVVALDPCSNPVSPIKAVEEELHYIEVTAAKLRELLQHLKKDS